MSILFSFFILLSALFVDAGTSQQYNFAGEPEATEERDIEKTNSESSLASEEYEVITTPFPTEVALPNNSGIGGTSSPTAPSQNNSSQTVEETVTPTPSQPEDVRPTSMPSVGNEHREPPDFPSDPCGCGGYSKPGLKCPDVYNC
jgi:hypothetical protein